MFMDGFFAATALEAAQRINSTVFFYLYDHRNEHTLSERTGNVTDELGKEEYYENSRITPSTITGK